MDIPREGERRCARGHRIGYEGATCWCGSPFQPESSHLAEAPKAAGSTPNPGANHDGDRGLPWLPIVGTGVVIAILLMAVLASHSPGAPFFNLATLQDSIKSTVNAEIQNTNISASDTGIVFPTVRSIRCRPVSTTSFQCFMAMTNGSTRVVTITVADNGQSWGSGR
jgi:hypothetical protein